MKWWRQMVEWFCERLGGRARARVIILLAMTLGLEGADLGAVGAMSSILQHVFSISKAQVGLLITASQGVGFLSTLFFGRLADRTSRTRLLAIAVVIWGVATLASGAATSFLFLLIARIGLGLTVAATLPCAASLVGDFFPERERGKIYGCILAGEIVGTGIGFMLAGEIATLWWRLGFWVLCPPALLIAWWLYKLPEPERGGEGQLAKGQREIGHATEPKPEHEQARTGQSQERLMAKKARQAGVQPRERLVNAKDPGGQSLWWAIGYVLSVPTNVVLIICSALGYAFFADMRTFGIDYVETWLGLKHQLAVGLLLPLGLGALGGIWVGGRLGDHLLKKGYFAARVWVATGFLCSSVLFLLAAFWLRMLWPTMIFLICSAFSLGAVNPALDSARLDIMHPKLWGRAEAVRMMLRDATEAIGPVSFGWLAASLGGGAAGLHDAFLIMLIPLAIAAAIGFITFHTYPRDAVSAAEYRRKTMSRAKSDQARK